MKTQAPELPAPAAGQAARLRQGPVRSRRRRLLRMFILLVLAGLLGHALTVTHVSIGELVSGFHGLADIVSLAVPPRNPDWGSALTALVETFDIALVGTAVATVL